MSSTASRAVPAEDDPRWGAVMRRDPGADGTFVYSVKSTGVYCRPSCPSRLAKRENVGFHANAEEATLAGFRPCLRCRPDEPSRVERQASTVAAACRAIRESEHVPSIASLAAAAGMSRFHFQRVFKATAGVTPGAYAAAHRAERLRAELGPHQSVTGAIYGAGFNSSGSFYAKADGILGMRPGTYRRGAAGTSIRMATAMCSLGVVLVAASDRGVCAIALGDSPEALGADLRRRFPGAEIANGDAVFQRLVTDVVSLIEAPGRPCHLPLDIQGTIFEQQVWEVLRDIPPGTTASYSEIARRLGRPGASRAVARACRSNRLAVAIPCHRVIAADGALSGYRWGVKRKRALLDREK